MRQSTPIGVDTPAEGVSGLLASLGGAERGAQSGVPLMRGALMSARYDMEAVEPEAGHLHTHVTLLQVNPSAAEAKTLVDAGPHSNWRLA